MRALLLCVSSLSLFLSVVSECAGEYEVCATGECVLDASLCGICKVGQYLCPDGVVCSPSATGLLYACGAAAPLWNWTLPASIRVGLTLSLLTNTEKASLLYMVSPGVPRPGISIPAYNWWTEGQHGVGVLSSTGPASSGPTTSTLSCSWNPEAFRRMASMAAMEQRGRHNAAVHRGDRTGDQNSLTLFSPELNLVRYPLWGRVQECMGGEDPLLTSHTSAAFVTGLQEGPGADARVLATAATCKDFVVYDWETDRSAANASLTARDVSETYLPAFIGCVAVARASAVMATYYGVALLPGQGEAIPAVANSALLNGLLRDRLDWDGVVMSDCDAVLDQISPRGSASDRVHAAAAALGGGTDLELNIMSGSGAGCNANATGFAYDTLPEAVSAGLLNQSDLDRAVARVLLVRTRLGLFDPPTTVAYNALSNDTETLLTPLSVALTKALASQSLVLLQNNASFLPLRLSPSPRLALLGPAIDDAAVQLGDYADLLAPAVSIAAAFADIGVEVSVARGCLSTACFNTTGFPTAIAAVTGAQAVVLQLGLCSDACPRYDPWNPPQEGEGADRMDISLPGNQTALAAAVKGALAPGVPLLCVIFHGGVVDLAPVLPYCDAIISAGYPGMQGGPAIVDAILGLTPPAGRTTLTWYSAPSVPLLPPGSDYDMYAGTGRTYRYYAGPPPTFPFGYGLTYTTFVYSNLSVSLPVGTPSPASPCSPITVSASVCNSGGMDSDEVVQVYLSTPNATVRAPRIRLVAYKRTHVSAGSCVSARFVLEAPAWALSDDAGVLTVFPGLVPVSLRT